MKKKQKNWGMAMIAFVLVTSMLSVFQYASLKKFDVNVVIAVSTREVYQHKARVDENATALTALSAVASVVFENGTIKCVQSVCNNGNRTWVVMNERGAQIDPLTHKLKSGETLYYVYAGNDAKQEEEALKAQKDAEAIKRLLKLE